MNFVYLKTFIIVCQTGGFTKAANKLFIPQPTVSNRITGLEEELEKELFLRNKNGRRGITLTESGKKFLPYAKRLLETFDSIKKEMSMPQETRTIKIGSTIPLSHPLILSKISTLLSADERRKIQTFSISEKEVSSEIIERNIDIAFVKEPVYSQSVETTLLSSDQLELVIPSNHNLNYLEELVDVELLKDENMILFDNHLLPSNFLRKIQHHCSHIINTVDIEFINTMVCKQKAITILLSSFITDSMELKSVCKIPISEEVRGGKLNYYMVQDENFSNEQKEDNKRQLASL